MSLRYFRKAADKGSAQAQYDVGDKLEPSYIAPKIAFQMYRCAAEQGHGEAAVALGIHLKNKGLYKEALEAFQLGVAAGDSISASFLSKAFLNPPPSNELHYLDQQEDSERAERYRKIGKVLGNYSYANPKAPEINEILPLPPAKLPEWDGKLQWLEARLANVPPQKPSEALINQLAKAKVLDPATGKPMPGAPGFSQAHLSFAYCYSGQACPQAGYWAVVLNNREYSVTGKRICYFEQGEIMPTHVLERHRQRIWPLSDKITQGEEVVQWGLYARYRSTC
jgi:hypothetical protein